MASVAGIASVMNKANATNKIKGLKGLGLGGLVTAGFCLFDFAEVPKAFNLKYNKNGEKVEGTNWKAGINEILKSIPKCVQMLVFPALITAVAAGFNPVTATLAGILAFAVPMGGYAIFDKLLPHEDEVIKLACKEKGIDISNPEGTLA